MNPTVAMIEMKETMKPTSRANLLVTMRIMLCWNRRTEILSNNTPI